MRRCEGELCLSAVGGLGQRFALAPLGVEQRLCHSLSPLIACPNAGLLLQELYHLRQAELLGQVLGGDPVDDEGLEVPRQRSDHFVTLTGRWLRT